MQSLSGATADAPASTTPHNGVAYLPGLDGIRALAVLAVLFYHAEFSVYGGYLGVESFFALSGFLITSLLLAEWQKESRISITDFWMRRARRLLPVLFVMLAVTLVATMVLLPNTMAELTQATVAAIAYVINWYLIITQQSYFDAVDRPPLLQHLWSLAIEEQFYLVWPLLFGLGMRVLRRKGFLALTLAVAVASAVLMATLYDPGADPSRVYYGTDTRASGLLLGAVLALVWSPTAATAVSRRRAIAIDVAGLLGLVALLIAYAVLGNQVPLLYRGGFTFVSLVTLLIIAVATHPAARFTPWLLELPPLRWIGMRSYGLYLWHWPIFQLTRPGIDLPYEGIWIQVLRFGLTFAVAALSYSLIEMPIRRGALGQLWKALRKPKRGGDTDADVLPEATTAESPGFAQRQVQRYRRWTPLFATSTLALGVACIAASITQAAIGGAFSGASGVANAQSLLAASSEPVATTPGTASGLFQPTSSAQTTSTTQSTSPSQATAAGEATTTPAEPETIQFDQQLAVALQNILDQTVADGAIPGAVLSVRMPDGSTWVGASGITDRSSGEAMQPETRVRIGSLSKMFTAIVALQLVQEGVIGLDAPVATWLPDLLPNGDEVTVRNLLQHTSGLYDYLEDRRFVAEAYRDPARVWQPREMVDYATQFPPTFAPGSEGNWDYSNTNFVVLGMIIEAATGNTFEQELDARILMPLALDQTTFVRNAAVKGPLARGYSQDADQTDVALSFAFATANIVTTASDLQRFGSALFAGELLEPETMQAMQQFVDGKGRYNMPDLAYGLGLMRNRLPVSPAEGQTLAEDANLVLGHIGGFGGFRAALWYAPQSDTLLALSVNQASTDPNDLAMQVLAALLAYQGGQ